MVCWHIAEIEVTTKGTLVELEILEIVSMRLMEVSLSVSILS